LMMINNVATYIQSKVLEDDQWDIGLPKQMQRRVLTQFPAVFLHW